MKLEASRKMQEIFTKKKFIKTDIKCGTNKDSN